MPTKDYSPEEIAEQQYQSALVACGFRRDEIMPESFDPKIQPKGKQRDDARVALAAVKDWVNGDLTWITFAGPPGTGKSHLLKAAIWRLHNRGESAFYITGYEFDRYIKDFEQSMAKVTPDEWVERLANNVQYLVLDDLGSGMKASDYNISRLERVFDIRARRGLPTGTAFNMLPDELETIVGMRVFSRLKDARLGRIVPMRCEDARPLLTSGQEEA
jgi:DNA replication protein DnaC